MIFSHNPVIQHNSAILFYKISSFGWLSFPGLAIWFALVIIKEKKISRSLYFYIAITVLPAFFIYLIWSDALIEFHQKFYGLQATWKNTIWSYLIFAYYTIFLIILIFIFYYKIKRTENIIIKKQLTIFTLTGLFPLFLGILTDMLLPQFNIYIITDLTDFFAIIWAVGISYSIVKYDFLTIMPATAADKVISIMPDCLILTDNAGNIIYANKQTVNLLGYRESELIGLSINDLFPSDILQNGLPGRLIDGEELKNKDLTFRSKKGDIIPVSFSSAIIRNDDGSISGAVCVAADMTEEKNIQAALLESESQFRQLIEKTTDCFYKADIHGHFTYANPPAEKLTGYRVEELLGMHFEKLLSPEWIGPIRSFYMKQYQERIIESILEFPIITKDGKEKWIEQSVTMLSEKGKISGFQCFARDTTQRKKAVDALQESDNRYKALFERSLDGVYLMDFDGNIIDANDAALKMSGYNKSDIKKLNFRDLLFPDQVSISMEHINEVLKTGAHENPFEFKMRRKDGDYIWSETKASMIYKNDEPYAIQSIARNITERKKAEKEMLRIKDSAIETSINAIILADLQGIITYVNKSLLTMWGFSHEQDIKNLSLSKLWKNKDDALYIMNHLKNRGSYLGELDAIKQDGKKFFVQVSASMIKDDNDRPICIMGSFVDITKRKLAELNLLSSEERYRLLADNVSDVIFTLDMNLRFSYVSPSIESLIGYNSNDAINLTIDAFLTPDSFEQAIETFTYEIEEEKKPNKDLYRTRTLELEMISKDNQYTWTEIKMTFLRDSDNRAIGILGIARDINKRKETEQKLEKSLERLRNTLNGTVHAIAQSVEVRDPYTAGHQRRVTDLAYEIAMEMGLSPEVTEGISIAGLIHDFGKISVPAEILSKPGHLTDIEYSLIKSHPIIGFDILKTIDFPWPIAEIIYQHHERNNGTGYPQGIHEKDILIEAKIIAVADVVEAMASHRPYRPSMGLKNAIDEILTNRGTLYDPDVVDACIRLFEKKKYSIT